MQRRRQGSVQLLKVRQCLLSRFKARSRLLRMPRSSNVIPFLCVQELLSLSCLPSFEIGIRCTPPFLFVTELRRPQACCWFTKRCVADMLKAITVQLPPRREQSPHSEA